MRHEHKSRGHRWRVQSDDRGRFDEIVVVTGKSPKPGQPESGFILHAEMMDNRSCFVDVAGVCLWVHVGTDGVARITMSEDRRPCAVRADMPEMRDPALDKKPKPRK